MPSSTRPSIDSTPSNNVIITEGFNGRQQVYRDLSKRSSNSSSIRRSTTMSDRSPISTPASASSPSYTEVKPPAPMPPQPTTGFPFPERTRAPYPTVLPPAPGMIITPGGTAVYDRPPSLELPRAFENERPSTSGGERRSSVSSTQAEVNDPDEPTSSRPRRRPSIKINTGVRRSTTSSSASIDSPRLSDLPRVGNLRRDSGREVPRRDSKKVDRERSYSDRQCRTEQDRRRRDEDDRQARLERERLAESERRQSARGELARAASRERHRQEAAAALEGQQLPADPIQQARDDELAQMARERADAARRRESDNTTRCVDDRLRRDADRARYQSARNSPINQSPRRLTGDNFNPTSSPISARSLLSARPPSSARSATYQPILHQYPSARRNSNTIRERGHEVIARQQARAAAAATERLTDAMARARVEETYDDEYDLVDDYYVGESEEQRRRRRAEERVRGQRFYS